MAVSFRTEMSMDAGGRVHEAHKRIMAHMKLADECSVRMLHLTFIQFSDQHLPGSAGAIKPFPGSKGGCRTKHKLGKQKAEMFQAAVFWE
ncbi:MAG: hypothetical protein ABSE16_01825 [Verrucomicrobiota bacterium]|jgi:hypothetical protein